MPETNPYVGEFEGRRSVTSMGGVGVRTPTFHIYYQESKAETADVLGMDFRSLTDQQYANYLA